MTQYRAPQAFIQFIGETLLNVAPSHILSVRTTKSLGSPAGTFELMFKTSDVEESPNFNPLRPTATGKKRDWWLEQIQPMTVAIIAMGGAAEMQKVQTLLSTPERLRQNPAEFLTSLQPEEQAVVRRSVVMVGLVEEVTLTTSMSAAGPQRVLRVTGRDFGAIMVDDSLRRIFRSVRDRSDAARLVTVGTIPQTELDRLLVRSSFSQENKYWQQLSGNGLDSKIKLSEAIQSILLKAPSHSVTLKNGQPLRNYFKRVNVSDELKAMYVRGTLMLFTYNGPIWEAITQLAPIPLAEVFVDTDGLENVLYVRRPPFFRPGTMRTLQDTMKTFLTTVGQGAREGDVMSALTQASFTKDAFLETPLRLGSVDGQEYHVIESSDLISTSLTKGSRTMFSQYQCVPAVLLRGQDVDQAVLQGAIGSYLYDLPAALRFGSRFIQAVCPWDTVPDAPEDGRVRSTTSSTELALTATETVRMYYYFRDLAAFQNGSIVIRGRPEVRIGDRVNLPEIDDLIGYVESVQHNFQFGSGFVTQIMISRGQPRVPTARLMPYDADPPKINMPQVPAVDQEDAAS